MSTDWWAWIARWDAQQERYLPHREERFSLMLDLIAKLRGEGTLSVLDLCCGNGSLSRRLLNRFPDVTIVAVDYDPVHVEIGRRTLGERVEWIEADVRQPEWSADVQPGTLDAVVTATALHWIAPADLSVLYRTLASLLAPGGVFLNADHFPVLAPGIATTAEGLLEAWQAPRLANAETHADFHEASQRDPELAALAEERERRFGAREFDEHDHPSVEFHRSQLLDSGFAEVGEVWRYLSDAVLPQCVDPIRPRCERRQAGTSGPWSSQ